MATDPQFSATPNVGQAVWLPATTANTKSDGTGTIGTDMLKVLTAGASGSFVQKVRATPSASAASTATTATVLRLYVSTVSSGATTSANTTLVAEVACPAQTADVATSAVTPVEIPLGLALKSGQYLLASMHHAAAASTAWHLLGVAGDY
jgi:hypothetical protein